MSNTAKTALQELLSGIVRSLVDRPEDVAIEVVEGVNHSTLQIRSHPADIRRLIGEHGRTADAIRVLVNASAVKRGFGRFNVEFEKVIPSPAPAEWLHRVPGAFSESGASAATPATARE